MNPNAPQSLIEWMIAWITMYPTWTGVIIFSVAMLESLVIVGVLVPGALMMIVIGSLIAIGALDVWSTLAWAVAGAIVGDAVSYWLGYYYRDQLRSVWPFTRFSRLIEKGERFFLRHGGKSIVFGRFVGPVRAIIPTIAGMMAMSPARFTMVNIISAIAWAPAYILPGYVFGASLELASEIAARFIILLLLLIIILLLTRWLVRRIFMYLQPRADKYISQSLIWGRNHPVLGKLLASLVDPRHPESPALITFAFLLLVAGFVFSFILWNVIASAGHTGIDLTVFNFMSSLRNPWSDSLMVAITMLGDTRIYATITIVVLLWLFWKRNMPATIHWIGAILFGAIMVRILKTTLQIPRPMDVLNGASGYAFPSAHGTMGMIIYGFLAVLIARELKPEKRRLVYVLSGLLIILIATSRVYLGVHWLSDISGGLALGIAWVSLIGIAYRRHHSPPVQLRGFLSVLLTTFLLASSIHIFSNHEKNLKDYALVYPQKNLAIENWRSKDWQNMPIYRDDLGLSSKHPINIQWVGSLEYLEQYLQGFGWRPPGEAKGSSMLHWLNPESKLEELPVFPQVHKGRHESLLLTLPDKNQNKHYVLRLWPADIKMDNQQSLWIGNIATLSVSHRLNIVSYPVTDKEFDFPLQILVKHTDKLKSQLVSRNITINNRDISWNGDVLLLEE